MGVFLINLLWVKSLTKKTGDFIIIFIRGGNVLKTPLNFQLTDYDCGPVSLKNDICFLFERNDIPIVIIKKIDRCTMDIKKGGTSKKAVNKYIKWLNNYAKKNDINIKCERLTGKDVTLNKIKTCINNYGCVLIRCWQGSEHYVIMTNLDNNNAYIFDPYYLDKTAFNEDSQVQMVFNKCYLYNRLVSIKRIFEESKSDFSLGKICKRECVLFYRL